MQRSNENSAGIRAVVRGEEETVDILAGTGGLFFGSSTTVRKCMNVNLFDMAFAANYLSLSMLYLLHASQHWR
jgi:hypothetical protein